MKNLPVSFYALSEEVVNLQYYLEDHYESRTLARDLKRIRTKLVKLIEYKPVYEPIEKEDLGKYYHNLKFLLEMDRDELAEAVDNFKRGCIEALPYLEAVTAESNVFDIIDALRDVYNRMLYYLGSYDKNPYGYC